VKEFYIKVVQLSSAVSSAVVETGSKVLLKLADFVKEHEDEIKKIVGVLQEFIEGQLLSTSMTSFSAVKINYILMSLFPSLSS
jgi:hypothetical protein